MPELPDVEVYKRYLDATSLHRTVAKVRVFDDTVLRGTSPRSLQMTARGRSFEGTRRYGKYLFADMGEGRWMVFHFGMTGDLKAYRSRPVEPDHTRILFQFEDGWNLAYIAPRKLGRVDLIGNPDRFIEEKKLGPDPWGQGYGLPRFRQVFRGRRGMIKTALMNQEALAGIGNVYSDEILFQAGIHPERDVRDLSEEDLKTIYRTMKRVLDTAIRDGADPERFPKRWLTRRREDKRPCPRCPGTIRKRTVGGRSSYFCPRHQKGGE